MTPLRFARVALLLALCSAAVPPAQAQQADRVTVGIDFTGAMVWPSAEQAVSFDLNAEQGDFRARRSPATTAGATVHADATLWRRMTLGGAVSYESGGVETAIDARLPHPFFFNRPRSVAGTVDDMTQNALGLAIRVGWQIPMTHRFDLHVMGGPLWVRLDSPVVTAVRFVETLPFNTASFTGADTASGVGWGTGLTVGANVGWRWRRHLGFESGMTFRHVSVDVTATTDRRVMVDAGRLRAHAGVRLSY